ncbi:MAG: hypothetical protein EPN93_11840 [Spirochaetes bacterium]|nr:MAG: hypothetical protein EPN93_11840 [Spirochaetota bacterium]
MRIILRHSLCIMGAFLAVWAPAGCGAVMDNLGFGQPTVRSVSPANNAVNIPGGAEIVVRFSKEMDRVKTAEEFSLSTTEGEVYGYFSWEDGGTTMRFQPRTPLDGTLYTVSVSTGAEDMDGNDLEKEFSSVFYVNTDSQRPAILSYDPANDSLGISPLANVNVNFSEPVDLDSIYSAITLTPSVEGTFQWNPAHTSITFDPLYELEYGTTYTATVSDSLRDANGNSLQESLSFNFTVGDDFIKPTVLSVLQLPAGAAWDETATTNGIERAGDLLITFSEQVARADMEGAITLTPDAGFYIDANITDTTARLVFDSPLESETAYTLKIAKSIRDVQHNQLEREYAYRFFTNGPLSLRPTVLTMADAGGDWNPTEIEPLTYAGLEYAGVVIRFSQAMRPASINVTIDIAAGSAQGSPQAINPEWNGALTEYTFAMDDMYAGKVYRIRVKGGSTGARDANGNSMKEDFVQYVRF